MPKVRLEVNADAKWKRCGLLLSAMYLPPRNRSQNAN